MSSTIPKEESLIGLQYLQKCTISRLVPFYKCTLCGYFAVAKSIFHHLFSLKHKEKYINKAFLFQQIPKPSHELIKKIAEAVEAVEGISKFVTDLQSVQQPSDSSSEQIVDCLLEKLAESGMRFQHPSKSITFVEDVFNHPNRKGALIGLQYLQNMSCPKSGPYYKCTLCGYFAITMSIFDHLFSLNHKEKYITKAFPFLFEQIPEPSNELVEKIAEAVEAVEGIPKFVTDHRVVQQPSDISSEQIVDRLLEKLAESGMHFQNPARNIKGISTIVTTNRVSAQPSKHQPPQLSLSCCAPISSSFASSSGHFSLDYQMCRQDCLPQSMGNLFQAFSHDVSENHGRAQKHHLSVYHFSTSTLSSAYRSFPSGLPWVPPSQNVDRGSGGETHQTPKGYAHVIPNDVHSPYAAEGIEHRQYSTPSEAMDLQPMRTISVSRSSITCSSGPFSAKDGSGQGSLYYDVSSVSCESPLPSGITHVLNKESSYPRSREGTCLSQVYPPFCTVSPSVQYSQGTYSTASIERIFRGLSPDTLKILQGKDVATVKSILNRVSEYYPPLKQVNISIFVDILFETGALTAR